MEGGVIVRMLILVLLFPVFLISCISGKNLIGDLFDGFYDYYYEEEIDCSDPAFTRTEPMPFGTYPEEFVTPPGYYWNCDNGDIIMYYADGTLFGFIGTFRQDYSDFSEVWNACRVGSRPPTLRGRWVVRSDNGMFCQRLDITPGALICREASSDGFISTYNFLQYTYRYGTLTGTVIGNSMTCYLD